MRTAALLLLLLVLPLHLSALDVPPLRAHINDYAHLFSTGTAQEMDRALAEFEARESTQIVVLTIPTLAGENLEEYSIKVAEAWKIGLKGIDSGVILLITKQEHKIRIEVGRGLEGRLTDLLSGRIIRDEITSHFRTGDFDGGLRAGLTAIMLAVKGEYQGKKTDVSRARRSAPPIFGLLIFLFVALVFLGAMSKVLGGIAGAVGLPIAAHLAFSSIPLLILAGLGLVGFVLGLIVSTLFAGGHGRWGGPGGGGPWFWGGFGGGSGGGGGFGGDGGFSGGGGSFGGGGASGDW